MNQVINLDVLDKHLNKYVAINKYRYLPMPDIESEEWFCKTFTGASIIEFKDTGILYILPAGYSQRVNNSSVNRQQVYHAVFHGGNLTHRNSEFSMVKEDNNQFDSKAIKFNYFDGLDILDYHMGYVPSPLNHIIYPMISTHADVEMVYMMYDLNGKYQAPIFKWQAPQNGSSKSKPLINRFTALLYEDD